MDSEVLDAVPVDFQLPPGCELEPLRPGEKLLGPHPEHSTEFFRAAAYDYKQALEALAKHEAAEPHDDNSCASYHVAVYDAVRRGKLLMGIVDEMTRDTFQPKDDGKLALRAEGVAELPPQIIGRVLVARVG